ncbi:hypothetical protein FH609_002345 [Streptomyces sp. 3MP-14]|uniref:Uncharacterized protein n=1 Tax=Streptomyces mimosae TaxID=2586635 RepID=A0A5N6ASZ7_9ACTN|nr:MULTISPECIES: hypothetical protein [Streptomyces]KAB8170808.1 hypothetical protein FH607_000125 [Streptomyces mimosae]KAB8179839.1 hypothetical protein FH609_002345 [Streptomyces sp. 3MP-14]
MDILGGGRLLLAGAGQRSEAGHVAPSVVAADAQDRARLPQASHFAVALLGVGKPAGGELVIESGELWTQCGKETLCGPPLRLGSAMLRTLADDSPHLALGVAEA